MVVSDPSKMKINCVAVSPSGKCMATCGDDYLVKIWDLTGGTGQKIAGGSGLPAPKLIATGVCHTSAVNKVQWSPDEKQLVSVGEDCSICVWNFYG